MKTQISEIERLSWLYRQQNNKDIPVVIKKIRPRQKKINYAQAENTAASCEQQILDLMEKSALEFFFLRNEADTPFCLIICLPVMPRRSK